MKLAILGPGRIARTVAPTLAALAEVELYAVASRTPGRAEDFADTTCFSAVSLTMYCSGVPLYETNARNPFVLKGFRAFVLPAILRFSGSVLRVRLRCTVRALLHTDCGAINNFISPATGSAKLIKGQ